VFEDIITSLLYYFYVIYIMMILKASKPSLWPRPRTRWHRIALGLWMDTLASALKS